MSLPIRARKRSYSQFLVLSKEFLGKANKSRLGILIEGTMPAETSPRYTQARSPSKIKRLALADQAEYCSSSP